jgi:structural maintenance of chromosome 4
LQVDADFKLKDMKKAYKEFEIKGKSYRKKLDELQTALSKHLEQYVFLVNLFGNTYFTILTFL